MIHFQVWLHILIFQVSFGIVKDRKTQLNTHSPRSCRGTWQPGIFGKHDKSISDHCIVMLNRWWGVIGT